MYVNAEKRMFQKVTNFITLGFQCIFLCACLEKPSDDLYGGWAVLEVFYGDEDISGIDRQTKFVLSQKMTIDDSKKIIFLPVDSERTEYGYFNHFRKSDKDWLRIYGSTDRRFDGLYLIHLQLEYSRNNGKTLGHSLVLESEKVYIYAMKYTASI
jgi:hypothetical protein